MIAGRYTLRCTRHRSGAGDHRTRDLIWVSQGATPCLQRMASQGRTARDPSAPHCFCSLGRWMAGLADRWIGWPEPLPKNCTRGLVRRVSSRGCAATVSALPLAGDVCRAGTGDRPAELTAKSHSFGLAPMPAFLLIWSAQMAESARSAVSASHGPVHEGARLALAAVVQR